ncbi:MAG: acyl-CoA carboxylase subunit beta [Rhodothermales bacterium]
MAKLGTDAPVESASYASRVGDYDHLLVELHQRQAEIRQGGGQARVEREHSRGKLTARERVARLVDSRSSFLEFGVFAGDGMYDEEGGCPGGGVVTGIGRIEGRLCMIVANDATVKAGAWFPITAKKNLRAQEIAMENHLPIIYLVDSAGVYLPMQDEIFPDREHFGRIFRNNAILSARGIPQIAAIMGSCVAGGAYLPIMSDEALIVDGTGSVFLAGPYLVKAAIGEEVDQETLGGAQTHSQISGVTDYRVDNDEECLHTIRQLVAKMGPSDSAGFRRDTPRPPAFDARDIYGIVSAAGNQPYDMEEILARLIDADSWVPYKEEYGKTILTGYASIDGWSVGIVANQRAVVKNARGEMQVGGVIYSDSADKAARFIMICNQKRIPLVFVQDVTGFMVGKRSEQGGIIKDGAKMVNAVANSVVPKFTLIVGNSYGAGNYAMCGKAYDPRLILAWPTARIAVMGGNQAAKTLLQIQVSAMSKSGQDISEDQQRELLSEIQDRYDRQSSPYYAAARLWVDEIIDPVETREWISTGIEVSNHQGSIPDFRTGVLQT